jgi:hypothetical protein
MKTFRQLMHEGTGTSSADNFVGKPADDAEATTTAKPRSKGEEDFVNQHMVQKTDYYAVPGQDHVFNGDRSEVREEVESLDEAVLDTLKDIVKKKGAQTVKFANGKSLKVDMTTASMLLSVYNQINDANKKKLATQLDKGPSSFMKMVDFAFSVGK